MFEFNEKYNLIRDGDEYIKLTPMEAKILKKFLDVPTETLLGYEEFDAKTYNDRCNLRTRINRINTKLSKYFRIASVPKRGYFLVKLNEEE